MYEQLDKTSSMKQVSRKTDSYQSADDLGENRKADQSRRISIANAYNFNL